MCPLFLLFLWQLKCPYMSGAVLASAWHDWLPHRYSSDFSFPLNSFPLTRALQKLTMGLVTLANRLQDDKVSIGAV